MVIEPKSLLFGSLLPILLSTGCFSGKENLYKETGVVMGTVVEITVAHRSEPLARAAIKEAIGELQRIDELMSLSKPGSLVSRINREGSTKQVVVPPELFRLLGDAIAISKASGGAFDVTVRPLVELWGFERGGSVPPSDLLTSKLTAVGYRSLILGEKVLSVGFAKPGMGLDLGAIAKGWAVDRAIEKLEARGIRNAIIDAGGDLRILGGRPGKQFWRIGVQHPREPGALLATFELRDTAIVTSGDYERFFLADGVRYHHILDPETGEPARGCQSVTVLAATASEADACATAAFVLGPVRGLAFLRSRPGVRGLIVDAAGALHWTDDALARLAGR